MLKIIAFFIVTVFNGIHGMAAPLLTVDSTFRRGSLEIDFREANSVLSVPSTVKADEVFGFFEKKVMVQVPDAFQSKISKRAIRIIFEKNLEKAAIFTDQPDPEPLLVRVRSTLVNDPQFFRVLTHEWFHALHCLVHPDEPAWLREGLAQVFETMVMGGYNGPNLISALESSSTPLNHEFNIAVTNREAYGHTFLYFYYLYQKCGKNDLFWKLVESSPGKFAEQTVDQALSQVSPKPDYCGGFQRSLIHAEIARFHNRKLRDFGGSSDEYLIIPELSRSPKEILTAKDAAAILPSLPKYEPKIFQASALGALNRFVLSEEWAVYSLGQSTPYTVKMGLGINRQASPPDLIFVMRIK